MKFKALSLLAGAVVLTLTTTSFAVNAQSRSNTPLVVAQAQQLPEKFQRLGLSDSQTSKIGNIYSQMRSEISGVLTEEQRQQYQSAIQNGTPEKQAFKSLQLSEEQKTQIKAIKNTKKEEIQGVLTPEQRQQLQQFKQNRGDRRQQTNS
ncbi:MAG: P pilus assembly/Cpx signaling pathway, periplasmic inhibitor/zinc-resistance associated protein [Calothrix sp. CSU_2_0]|nr:P pilus assembly/Cpx signaling pathway, periplasmic inhibitor/zinc-resistance associated protein [Calothrix sp. CSU_2_0]